MKEYMEDSNQLIDELLDPFKPIIGEDFHRYKNHILRVYHFCLLLDDDKSNNMKYAIAAVFHDIGIWTKQTIDYLEPSIDQSIIYLTKSGREEWIEEINLMIYWHHKISSYTGNYVETVENFRKADWIDVSLGILSFGANKRDINKYRKAYPNLGFHLFLARKLTGNFFKHPFNPLPMFTK